MTIRRVGVRVDLLTFVVIATMATPPRLVAQPRRSLPPDLILTGAKVFTADAAHPWAQAVAIRGDRIVAVGRTVDIERLAGPRTRRIPLGGRVVVPGFNDAHDHIGNAEVGVGFVAGAGPVPDPGLAEVLDSVRAIAARTPADTWLHAMVGERILADSARTRAPLDSAAPRHRVMLQAWTGHDVFLNTAALRALGIPDDARDPLGGHYGRDAAGRLNGHLEEYAVWNAERRLYSSLPDSAIAGAFRRYADDAIRLGITSVQDMNGYLDPATTTRVLRALDLPIRLRVVPYPMTDVGGALGGEWAAVPRQLGPRITVSGVKWLLDGTPIDRRTLMRAAYGDAPGWHGALEFPADSVRAMLARALATREPLHLHVTGDSSVRIVLSLMQAMAPDSAWRAARVRLEHGDLLTGELLPAARRLGVVVVQNPTHFALDQALLTRRFGRAAEHMMDVRAIVDAGVPLAIGSDGPRSPGLNLMFAVTHPLHPASALTREQAVTAYTRGSAYAERAEREKGTIAPGMLADLAVLSQDVFTVPAASMPATFSVLTIVGGRVVWNGLTSGR